MAVTVAASTQELPLFLNSPLGANGRPEWAVGLVESPLESNIAVFEGEHSRVAIVTVDTLFVGPTLTRALHERAHSIDEDLSLWVSSSHTHRAPAMDYTRPGLGRPVESQVDAIVEKVGRQLETTVSAADRVEVLPVRSTADLSGFSIHRRSSGRLEVSRKGIRCPDVKMAPNEGVPVQSEAGRIDWMDSAGRIRLVMWHWACHPTAFPDPGVVSSDYIGVVRERIRGRVGRIPVLFFQGFSGDIRPPSIRSFRRNPIRRTLQGPGFRRFEAGEYRDWSSGIADAVASAKAVSVGDSHANFRWEDPSISRLTFDSGVIASSSPSSSVVCQVLRLPKLRMVGISAEPSFGILSDQDLSLGPEGGDGTVWFCGYLEDAFGYLPTVKQFFEGGYEVDGFRKAFGCGRLRVEGIDLLAESIRAFAIEA